MKTHPPGIPGAMRRISHSVAMAHFRSARGRPRCDPTQAYQNSLEPMRTKSWTKIEKIKRYRWKCTGSLFWRIRLSCITLSSNASGRHRPWPTG